MFPLCAIPTAVLKMGSELHSRDAVWTIILSAETALQYGSSILTVVWMCEFSEDFLKSLSLLDWFSKIL